MPELTKSAVRQSFLSQAPYLAHVRNLQIGLSAADMQAVVQAVGFAISKVDEAEAHLSRVLRAYPAEPYALLDKGKLDLARNNLDAALAAPTGAPSVLLQAGAVHAALVEGIGTAAGRVVYGRW